MRLPNLISTLSFLVAIGPVVSAAAPVSPRNSTYYNPILPGWHSDPSCAQVNGTFYCVTSTFISFPGLPIYASKDLVNWKMVSHAWNRESQLPGASARSTAQQVGMFAATLRYHEGLFYVICEYLGVSARNLGVVFTSTDPFDDRAWSDPVTFESDFIDPDLFWDDDGKAYVATQGIVLQEINLATGELSQPPISLWNGTGGVWPEGPHLYRKDGWYYLMIAEGGTATDHSITIARSRNLKGPYAAYENNPILTNRGTDEYFQTVGHGDLFQDEAGNWWGVALATRSGPEWEIYPMGRETVLFPVTWDEDEWPVLQPVRGKMSGWRLPPPTRKVPGTGPFNTDDDVYDFRKGEEIPRNLVYWRVPPQGVISIAEKGLQMIPTRNNLTGTPESATTPKLTGQAGLSFIGRRQTHTLFTFSVDVSFSPRGVDQEAGVTVFLTQFAHIDLGIVLLAPSDTSSSSEAPPKPGKPELAFRFRAEGTGTPSAPKIVPVPSVWRHGKIRLQIETLNATHYSLLAMSADNPRAKLTIGTASAGLVSGGSGSFVGSLVGAYATCNGAGSGHACPEGGNAYFSRWRYRGEAQYISATESVRF
ncbi:glycoside hydrolase family 43 protein [Xylaria bambusicola]|uniref:glycoside hydrolase family 43 protein n=1 Tax=Xylaria bambusicola TaxID=326684 RepID=UPI0020072487|nr:glycoside hydrolase family 43 protein [Xylaria bambusicola]KAI0521765.1 glycoside hydrolase family 43 protein [Xylaria bambusicola]